MSRTVYDVLHVFLCVVDKEKSLVEDSEYQSLQKKLLKAKQVSNNLSWFNGQCRQILTCCLFKWLISVKI